jgi:hypothetical protein
MNMGTSVIEQYEKCLERASGFICFSWYGHDVFSEVVSLKTKKLLVKQFLAIIKSVAKLYDSKIRLIIENKNVIDVMYWVMDNDKYCEEHRLFILVLAYTLFKEKRLYFSTPARKYTYMVRVSKISQHVVEEIKRRNKYDTWLELMGCAITCFLGYILS